MSTKFLEGIDSHIIIAENSETKKSIFKEYERVILDSLLQTFGLDFIIQDQYGGDVDTIHNLDQVGKNSDILIKNKNTLANYEGRGEYAPHKYHSDKAYIEKNKKLSQRRKDTGIVDAYTHEMLKDAHDLDHIIAAKNVHNNAAVYATSLDPISLVNSDDNLVPTISTINRSKGAKTVNEFLSDWEKTKVLRKSKIKELRSKSSLSEKEKKQLLKYEELEKLKPNEVKKLYKKSKQSIANKLNKDYYTSSKFAYDISKAAINLGGKMAIKQVIGFVLIEVWFAVKERLFVCNGNSLKDFFSDILEGVKDGFSRAKDKYKEILTKFKDGLISGIIASLMSTITNTVKTLLASSIKILRHVSIAVVQAFKILFFEQYNSWQEKIHAVLVLLGASASAIVGSILGSYLTPTLSGIPVIGDFLVTFIEIFISGILSCTFIYFIDKWDIAQKIYAFISKIDINPLGDYVEYMKQQVIMYESYVANLLAIDVETVICETKKYSDVLRILNECKSDCEINTKLKKYLSELNIYLPWSGDFSSFMGNKKNRLVFN